MSQTSLPHQRPLTAGDVAQARASIAPLQAALDAMRTRLGHECFTVAWMSDMHIHAPRPYDGNLGFYGDRVDCSFNFRLALTELSALAPLPDLLLFGGDLVDGGCGGEAPADEYAEFSRVLREALPPGLPTLAIAGNHDHGISTTAAWHQTWQSVAPQPWPASPDTDDYYFVRRAGKWRIIGLDSREDQPLSNRQRAWLADELARDPITPALVLIHRPMVTVGNWVDDIRLLDRATFDVLDSAPGVKAIWSGHTHLPRAWRYRGKKHVVLPSVAYGIPGPCGWAVGVFSRERLEAVFIKRMSGQWFDGVAFKARHSKQAVQRLPFRNYTADPLYNPCLLPRESGNR
ncbi:MAG: metallophosphoesterase [Cephaloticoccus sp.]|nr:metallophosphoesterase [Cephaloticoccus sp.]MCF7761849.1 metallophosphoesterase [Cephaloticoccus sp.]